MLTGMAGWARRNRAANQGCRGGALSYKFRLYAIHGAQDRFGDHQMSELLGMEDASVCVCCTEVSIASLKNEYKL